MPRVVDYPRASLKMALELAKAVDSLGGSCSTQLVAEKMGKKVGGAFSAVVGAASKYGLVDSKSQRLTVTALYKRHKLAYSDAEEQLCLREALLSAPLFKAIYDRFLGKVLPLSHFDRLLVREFEVPEDLASRTATYFLDGAKISGLLDSSGLLGENAREEAPPTEIEEEPDAQLNLATGAVASEASAVAGQQITPPVANHGTDRIPVRLGGGRRAWLEIPVPFYEADKKRLKSQIDLLLTEDEEDDDL
jgi:hypothetical protein